MMSTSISDVDVDQSKRTQVREVRTMLSTRNGLASTAFASIAMLAMMLASIEGCSKRDTSTPASAGDSMSTINTSASDGSVMPTDITPVRGTIASVSDSALVVATPTGAVNVAVDAPLHVYESGKADLSQVSSKSFVGVTSVKQPDGSQVATEIHIFPEDLRGTGEGSYLMTQQGASQNSRNRMTNGTVESAPKAGGAPRMTNGTVESAPKAGGGPPRMTNGAVASKSGQTLTVDYHGGSQTINIPPGVTVTTIEPSTTKLAKGANVIVLAKKQSDGTMKASNVMLAAQPK
jgi:hypothetical protein